MLLPRPPETFLGRDDELAWLRQHLPLRRVLVLKGMEGVGKTSLALALLQDLPALYVACPEGGRLEDLEAEIRGEAADPAVSPRARLLGLVKLLNEGRLTLCLDDAQNLPPESLGQLVRYLQTYLTGHALVVTSEELPLPALDRVDLLELRLEGLSAEASQRLLQALVALHRLPEPDPATVASLATRAAGHPLMVKLAASLLVQPAGDAGGLLERVQARLSEEERDVLELLSVAGGPVAVETLGPRAAVLEGLQRRFLVDPCPGGVRVNRLLGRPLAEAASPERRQALHRDLAVGPSAFGHLLRAGDREAALRHLAEQASAMCSQGRYRQLVEGADRLQASGVVLPRDLALMKAHALANLGRWEDSLEILGPLADAGDGEAVVARAGVFLNNGRWAEALAGYRKALTLLPEGHPAVRKAHHYLGLVHAFRSEIAEGREHLRQGRALPGADDPAARAHALRVEAALQVFGGSLEAGLETAWESARLASAQGALRLSLMSRYLAGQALLGLGRREEALALYEEALAEARRLGDPHATAWSLLGLGMARPEALEEAERAFRALGSGLGEAMARGLRGDPSVAREVAEAAERWGHPVLQAEMLLLQAQHAPSEALAAQAISLLEGRDRPDLVARARRLPSGLQVSALGGFRLSCGGASVREEDWPTRKAMRLAAALCVRPEPPSDVWLMDHLWPESDPDRARSSLRNAVHQVRGILRGLTGGADPVTRNRRSGTLALTVPRQVDAAEFEALARQGTVEALSQAVVLYRGDFLEGLEDEWVVGPQEHYREMLFRVYADLARRHLGEGRFEQAEAAARAALRRDDLREEPHSLLLQALVAQNRKADGMRHYRAAVELFERELGCRPRSLEEVFPRLVV